MSELKRHGFSKAKWEEFGLECGLHYSTLKEIEASNPKNVNKCFTECVAFWLKREDGVDGKGKPTLQRLADIVEEIGEKATAKEIRIQNGIFMPANDLIGELYINYIFMIIFL